MSDTLTPQMQDRIDRLVARFTLIGEQRMRDLPVYHSGLSVEATGFQPTDNGCIGVLITPWFMNLVLLAAEPQNVGASTGQKVTHELASGTHEFMVGEDEELGRYDFISLASPMFAFENQSVARQAAQAHLQKPLNPETPQPAAGVPEHTLHFASAPPADLKRRAFLRGRLRGSS